MLGVDVSKATLTYAFVDPESRLTPHRGEVPNTERGIQRLLQMMPPSPLVLEPTGRYGLLLARLAKAAGRCVLMAEPIKARSYLRSLPQRAKTDTLDSEGLARYALACPLSPYPLKDAFVQRLDELLSARKALVRHGTALKLQAQDTVHAADYLRRALQGLQDQIDALDKAIASAVRSDPRFEVVRHLQTVPGIGPVTSAAVASCLVARRFSDPDQFVAFIGLDPATVQSGQKDANGHISKRGDPELRRLLFLAAQSNTRSRTSPYRVMYEGYRERGMATTPALCAVARKLARTCWSIWKYETDFDPDRVGGRAVPSRT